MIANLLVGLRPNFRDFSDCSLINNANHLDFDSAIRARPVECSFVGRAFFRNQSLTYGPFRISIPKHCDLQTRPGLDPIGSAGSELTDASGLAPMKAREPAAKLN